MHIRVVPIHEEPIESWSEDLTLPQGEIGEIVVRGAVVTPSYYNRPQATKLAKIPTENGDVWSHANWFGKNTEPPGKRNRRKSQISQRRDPREIGGMKR